jgi:hypothetical protein
MEVVTYRLTVVFGSLRAQQLHGFDELCDVQGAIRNHSAMINKTAESLRMSSSNFSFRILQVKSSY